MTLGILLPTRGRPDNLDRFITAVAGTADDWHLYLRLDNDDPALADYGKISRRSDARISTYCADRVGFGASLNEMAAYAAQDEMTHLGMFGDDVVPETEHWDLALIEGLQSRLGVAYGDDGLRKKHAPDLPTHYVTQTEVYNRLGYLAPPTIRHLFLDNVARDVGHQLKNFVFVPVKINHLHPWIEGEHLHDATYAEGGRNVDVKRADQRAYQEWTKNRDWRRALR